MSDLEQVLRDATPPARALDLDRVHRQGRRRRRRPWVISAGVLAVVIVATGAVLLGGSDEGSRSVVTPPATQGQTPSTTAVAGTTTTLAPTTTTSTTSPGGLSSESRLGYAGLGPIELGMDFDAALQAAHATIGEPTGCEQGLYFEDDGAYTGVDLWRGAGNIVETIHVSTPDYRTISGIQVGSTRNHVLATYPNAQPYGEGPFSPDTLEISNVEDRVIVFLFRDGVVTSMQLAFDHATHAAMALC